MEKYKIYTDGSCWPNPGSGAYWFVVLDLEDHIIKQDGNYFDQTTSNRMELNGIIAGLEFLTKQSDVEVYTDSQLCVNTINKWIKKWRPVNFKKRKNVDLLKRLDSQLQIHSVKAIWIKGHNGDYWNEICNTMAGDLRKKNTKGALPASRTKPASKRKAKLLKRPI